MSLALLLASETLEAHYDHENAWLYLEWKGPQALAQVELDCRLVTAFIHQTGAHKVLNDNSRITHSSWELALWVAQVYLPQTSRAGLDYVAWVNSPVLECRSDTDLMVLAMGHQPQVAVFDDVADAYAWLRSMHARVAGNAA